MTRGETNASGAREACVLAQQRRRQVGDNRFRRVAQSEMAHHKVSRRVDLMLPIEGVQQGRPDFLNC
jgi:hypothetical protein